MSEDPRRLFLNARVEGRPAPKGSKRHVGGGRMIESSPLLTAWNRELDTVLGELVAAPVEGAVHICLDFTLAKPKALKYGIWHIKRPDIDKLARSVLDALVRQQVIVDDSQVAKLTVTKTYAIYWPAGVDIQGWRL